MKTARPFKELALDTALWVVSGLILLVVLYGAVHGKTEEPASEGGPSETGSDVYVLGGHALADFSGVIVEQFHKESKLVVYSADASVSVELKQTGFFDWDILNKTQSLTYAGTGRFYLDLSALGVHSIRMDDQRDTIAIEIPHTKLDEIEIDPDRFTCEKSENGLLAFGDLKFTAKEYNSLQVECKRRFKAAVDVERNYQAADRRAVEEMTKIYEPIVKAVDSTYRVEIVFIER